MMTWDEMGDISVAPRPPRAADLLVLDARDEALGGVVARAEGDRLTVVVELLLVALRRHQLPLRHDGRVSGGVITMAGSVMA